MRDPLSLLPILAVALIWLTLAGLDKSDAGATAVAPELLSHINAAPEAVKFGDSVLRLHADVWRNFMPLAGAMPDGRPMIASLVVIVESGPPVALHVDAIWIQQGDLIWQSHDIESGTTDSRGTTNDYVVRDGPRLKPGSYIDIVVRMFDLKGNYYFLSARHQRINAVS